MRSNSQSRSASHAGLALIQSVIS